MSSLKSHQILPDRKGNRGRIPKHLKIDDHSIQDLKVADYTKALKKEDWEEIKIRKGAKGTLRGLFHFKNVYIRNKQYNQIERRLLVIRKMKTKNGMDIKHSFTNADLVQYTPKALAYMQAQI